MEQYSKNPSFPVFSSRPWRRRAISPSPPPPSRLILGHPQAEEKREKLFRFWALAAAAAALAVSQHPPPRPAKTQKLRRLAERRSQKAQEFLPWANGIKMSVSAPLRGLIPGGREGPPLFSSAQIGFFKLLFLALGPVVSSSVNHKKITEIQFSTPPFLIWALFNEMSPFPSTFHAPSPVSSFLTLQGWSLFRK